VSDKRQFAIVMLIASIFVGWIIMANLSVVLINNKLKDDPEIKNYPYPFRVLRKEGGTAIMGTLRSESIPATIALKILFPKLQNQPDGSLKMENALKKMAYLQARAKQIVLSDSRFNVVGWELDENWFRLNGINIKKKEKLAP
jgi:hypothetical protein